MSLNGVQVDGNYWILTLMSQPVLKVRVVLSQSNEQPEGEPLVLSDNKQPKPDKKQIVLPIAVISLLTLLVLSLWYFLGAEPQLKQQVSTPIETQTQASAVSSPEGEENPEPLTLLEVDHLPTLESEENSPLPPITSSTTVEEVHSDDLGYGVEIVSPNVRRAELATAIRKREPKVIELNRGRLELPTSELQRLHFFTEIRGFSGKTVTHVWKYKGKVVAKVPIRIRSNRWRSYSSKYLQPSKQGDWLIELVDQDSQVLAKTAFFWGEHD